MNVNDLNGTSHHSSSLIEYEYELSTYSIYSKYTVHAIDFASNRTFPNQNEPIRAEPHFLAIRSNKIEFFKDKTAASIKNSKKFWQFYQSTIKLRSDHGSSSGPNLVDG
jgi:hypothetical protein